MRSTITATDLGDRPACDSKRERTSHPCTASSQMKMSTRFRTGSGRDGRNTRLSQSWGPTFANALTIPRLALIYSARRSPPSSFLKVIASSASDTGSTSPRTRRGLRSSGPRRALRILKGLNPLVRVRWATTSAIHHPSHALGRPPRLLRVNRLGISLIPWSRPGVFRAALPVTARFCSFRLFL